jgi:hypothetical protein
VATELGTGEPRRGRRGPALTAIEVAVSASARRLVKVASQAAVVRILPPARTCSRRIRSPPRARTPRRHQRQMQFEEGRPGASFAASVRVRCSLGSCIGGSRCEACEGASMRAMHGF